MTSLQFTLDNLPAEAEQRLEAIVQVILGQILPHLADEAELDIYELQSVLATELAYRAGVTLKPESALQMVCMLVNALQAGASEAFEEETGNDENETLHTEGLGRYTLN